MAEEKPVVAEEKTEHRRLFVRDKDFRLSYANVFRLRASQNDASIMFSVVTDEPQDPGGTPKPIISEVSGVLMPWHMIKLLSLELSALIQEFEAVHGVPPAADDFHAEKIAEVRALIRRVFPAEAAAAADKVEPMKAPASEKKG